MYINEVVKKFLKQPEIQNDKESSSISKTNVINDLSNSDLYPNTGAFFDNELNSGGFFGKSDISDTLQKQKDRIMKYRQVAMTPDVSNGIDEIVNEIIFSYDDDMPVKIEFEEENEKLVKAVSDKFKKIMKLINVRRNLFNIVKNGYIDGQIILHCAYDKNTTKNGIRSIKMIEPCMLYFDAKENVYKYLNYDKTNMGAFIQTDSEKFSTEEIVREDFGIYDKKINLGYLEYVIKPANILKTLEDLLIPLRFSRSISRRVFNVDIGDLPSKRGAEVMNEMQAKFKYKKFYNNETGEVSNQQHITSMVEDYWFANRSGGKGTTVDVLDESGNLGELGDIVYYNRKLYQAMRVPFSRIQIDPDADHEFDFQSTRVSKEDMKFYMFVSRLRQVYSSLFKEVLKREVVSTGVMSESEWEDREESIKITFIHENKFIEKMKLDAFMSKLEIYSTAQEYQGKLFPVETVLKDIFKYTDEEIKDNFEKIQSEENNPLFKKFYSNPDGEDQGKW